MHNPACSAFDPCDYCQGQIDNAIEARHAYNKALEILDELAMTPWVIESATIYNDTANFNRVYESLRNLRDEADRLVPSNDY